MKNWIDELKSWLYHRIRMCLWKMWKKPKARMRYLRDLGVQEETAYMAANCRRGYWWVANTVVANMALTIERLINKGFYDLANAYQSMHVNY